MKNVLEEFTGSIGVGCLISLGSFFITDSQFQYWTHIEDLMSEVYPKGWTEGERFVNLLDVKKKDISSERRATQSRPPAMKPIILSTSKIGIMCETEKLIKIKEF